MNSTSESKYAQLESAINLQFQLRVILAMSNGIEEAGSKILEKICNGLEWDAGRLWLVDQQQNRLCYQDCWPKDPKEDTLQNSNCPQTIIIPIRTSTIMYGIIELLKNDTSDFSPPAALVFEEIGNLIAEFMIRKETEKRVSLLASLVESSQNAIICTDLSGNIIFCNDSTLYLYGYSSKELIGRPASFLYSSEQQSLVNSLPRKIADNESIDSLEIKGIRKDGEAVYVSLIISPIRENTKLVGISISSQDITARICVEKELKRTNYLKQAILDSTNHMIIMTNTEGVIQIFNKAAENTLGYRAEEVVGKATPIIIHKKEEIERRAQELTKELGKPVSPGFDVFVVKSREGICDENEWTYVRKDGTCLPVLMTITSIFNSKNEIIGHMGVIRDLTERKKFDKMKEEFISTVSHELRTPLTSILGSLDLIIHGNIDDLKPDTKKMLEIAYRNGDRLVSLINDILDIDKIEAGKMTFNFEKVELGPLIYQLVETNIPYAEKFKVNLKVLPVPESILVFVDPNRLTQAITNLISNAIKFSPASETVIVQVERQHNHKVKIDIIDHGPGIPQEFRDRIFQKFSQSDSSDHRSRGGTGLGLSISKLIIENFKGEIGFVSEQGIGSTFFIILDEVQSNTSNSNPKELQETICR
jgi:PAS domain S-box-containing protein